MFSYDLNKFEEGVWVDKSLEKKKYGHKLSFWICELHFIQSRGEIPKENGQMIVDFVLLWW